MRVLCHLVREIGQGIRANIGWQSTAIFAPQNGAKDYMVRLFDDANLCVIYAWRQTIMPQDSSFMHFFGLQIKIKMTI